VKPEPSPEVELTRRLLTGDKQAFDRFVDLFRSRIFQYSFLMCGQREDAEEVAQETMLKAFEKIDQLREPERVKPWVFQIAKNACRMMRRKSIFAPREEVSLEERAAHLSDGTPLPDKEVLRHELHDQLSAAIRALPQIYRAVFLLREVEQLTTEETAQILDVSSDVVKTRLLRARRMMRASLGGVGQLTAPAPYQPGPLQRQARQEMLSHLQRRIGQVKRSRAAPPKEAGRQHP
jgi:RNA polymerase sigma-70 factor (ECF subfamily)